MRFVLAAVAIMAVGTAYAGCPADKVTLQSTDDARTFEVLRAGRSSDETVYGVTEYLVLQGQMGAKTFTMFVPTKNSKGLAIRATGGDGPAEGVRWLTKAPPFDAAKIGSVMEGPLDGRWAIKACRA